MVRLLLRYGYEQKQYQRDELMIRECLGTAKNP